MTCAASAAGVQSADMRDLREHLGQEPVRSLGESEDLSGHLRAGKKDTPLMRRGQSNIERSSIVGYERILM
jgi:hypothetical protein